MSLVSAFAVNWCVFVWKCVCKNVCEYVCECVCSEYRMWMPTHPSLLELNEMC